MNKREQAKQLFAHYIDLALDEPLQFDAWAEVTSIVDLIIDAAKEEIEKERSK
ncbi:MAG: hypothetical protein ACXAD7_24380 [Candidatus Kariarchaeaceae archaeon]|jgi:hypothetical protein